MIFSSPHGTLHSEPNRVVWDDLETQAQTQPFAPAFVCGLTHRVLSFGDVHSHAKAIVAGLHADGIRKGETVILLSINCVEFPVIFMALNRLQAICSPASPMGTVDETVYQINATKPVAIIVHPVLLDLALASAKATGIPTSRIYTIQTIEHPAKLPSIQALVENPRKFPDIPTIDPNAIVALPFSSGTTGLPKGVQLSAKMLYLCVFQGSYTEEDNAYYQGLLPFFHILAMASFQFTIMRGFALVVLPKFDPATFLGTIEKYRIKKVSAAPPIVLFLAHHPIVDKYDLSSVRVVASGGAPLGKEVSEMVMQRLGAKVQQGYGMTEFAGPVTMPEIDNYRHGSVGRIVPNVEMQVRSLKTDELLGVNQRGELLFRTPQTMAGYLNDPEATKATILPDGFLRTGDVGYIDEDGFVFIVDRVKSLIKYKGHQVAPAELEDIINRHPMVVDACCIRGKDKGNGEEIPKAVVVLKPDVAGQVTEEDIMEFVASKVAPYKRVREVEFVDEVPKTLSGKILRPTPCLVINILIECLPLRPISEGLTTSHNFWIRSSIGLHFIAFTSLELYRLFVPSIPSTLRQIVIMSFIVGTGTTITEYLCALWLGYPVPLCAVLTAPMFMALMVGCVAAAWGKFLKENKVVFLELQHFQTVISIIFSLAFIDPASNYAFTEQQLLLESLKEKDRVEYIDSVLKLLHMIEYLVLIVFTELIIPFVYSVYLYSTFHLPNHAYHTQLRDLTEDEIRRVIGNNLVYATLELLSLVILQIHLYRKFHISAAHQLAYVLERQWISVQLKLCSWFIFIIQFSVDHFGADYSFRFNWLKKSRPSA
ncbi:hypothetical protein Poli38472_005234 [Pythium oligandrum]|uniref:4-coumarate--CoA ligase n=1 Tax=Pythium oligandrum TaxID=41045 RepID=A0A8K1CFP0_PYTOL|nr:hypothetical protein Poli38472_005234 [Pythium oligandrum]|eukprot:TMW62616.1 hypothetical protein Poli38472_005234 [Pythium oligandrum]